MAKRTVNAFFNDYDAAASAVRQLEMAGIPDLDMSLVASNIDDVHSHRDLLSHVGDHDAGEGAGTGATLGTLAGGGAGLLAGLGMLTIPGFGPVVAAGWLVSTLVGAGAGAAVGGMAGALVDMGVGEDEAHRYADAIRRGGVLVSVRAEEADIDRIRAILDEAGQVDVGEAETTRHTEADTSPAPPIGAAASTTTGLTTDLMPNPLDEDESETGVEVEDERLRRLSNPDRGQ
ncbi:MAG TPA: hypothetical protein VEZ16_01410 [Microvirga sp.]|nr:hypothetical protein [Microvirga sp.]